MSKRFHLQILWNSSLRNFNSCDFTDSGLRGLPELCKLPQGCYKCWFESKPLIAGLCLEMWLQRPDMLVAARAACQWWIELLAGPVSRLPTENVPGEEECSNGQIPQSCLCFVFGPIFAYFWGNTRDTKATIFFLWSSALCFSSFLTKHRSSGVRVANSPTSANIAECTFTCQARGQLSTCPAHFLWAEVPTPYVSRSLQECLYGEEPGKSEIVSPAQKADLLAF